MKYSSYSQFKSENSQYRITKIRSRGEFSVTLNNLIYNLEKYPEWKLLSEYIGALSYELERNPDDYVNASKLNSSLEKLPNDPVILELAELLEDYLEYKF